MFHTENALAILYMALILSNLIYYDHSKITAVLSILLQNTFTFTLMFEIQSVQGFYLHFCCYCVAFDKLIYSTLKKSRAEQSLSKNQQKASKRGSAETV